MDMQGEQRIPAPRQKVWDALNDPKVLQQCIPGCESLDVNEDGGFDALVSVKVGPVKAKFNGSVILENINAPESYTITGEGKGGAAGFAKGGADVSLEEDGSDTLLRYTVKAQVGGKLAQLGGRLIDSTAKKYAKDFFNTFTDIVAGGKAPPQAEAEAEVDDGMKEAESPAIPAATSAGESEVRAGAAIASSAASIDVADAKKQSRKSLGPLTWTTLVITVVLALLLAFSL